MGVIIKSFGHFIPEKRITNAALAKRFGITEEWILERTGIEERRYFEDGATSDMIVSAAIQCLSQANVSPTEVDCIIVATMTPDHSCPSTASIVHAKLKTENAWGFDIMAACSGYIYALELASALLNSRKYKNVLVAGADKMSCCIDLTDRKTVLLLADGAGTTLLSYSESANDIVDSICKLDSSDIAHIRIEYGGSKLPITTNCLNEGKHYLRFESKLIFQTAINLMERACLEILNNNQMSIEDVDFIVPHQANRSLILALAEKLKLPIEKFIINVELIGNTSAASIPIAISEGLEQKILIGNETLLLVAVGAGYTFGANILTLNLYGNTN